MDYPTIIKPAPKTTCKAENPLFPIARDKHYQDYKSCDFKFLNDVPDNVDTYVLGFCRGVSHAADKMQKQIEDLQKKVQELENERRAL